MSTNKFLLSHAGIEQGKFPRATAILWSAVLALLLAGTRAPAAAGDQPAEEKPRSIVPVFRLEGPLTEVPGDDALQMFGPLGTSLKELVARLGKAADDSAVKAVVLLPESMPFGAAQVEELRAGMALVRGHGKDVYVHADSLVLGQYVLACGASRISVVPTGPVLIPGLHGSSLHVRGLLDKIGVKPDFITEGAYKSAAELFMREQPSPEADEMMNWLMDSWYASFKEQIAQGRKVDAGKVEGWLDSGVFTAEQAKTAGLIDAVEQHQDFEALLKERYGKGVIFDRKYGRKSQADVDFSSPFAFLKIWGELFRGPEKKAGAKPAVGIVYVNGPILDGKGTANPFGGSIGAFSTDVREALEKAAADETIEAVVLRIDSPGGSATASEIILDATKRLKAEKPLVVSMGDVAGSGGYYVACAADTVFADATTLTGSIGVLAGKLATTEMWKKVGITFKEYKRGQNAGIFSSDDVFTESERARMRVFMDEVYGVFKNHVTEIRGNRLKKPIDELAGGRVYTGKQALDLGLVDRLGTMSDAVAFAAEQAKIKDYDVRVVPEPKNFLEQLMEQLSGGKDETGHVGLAADGGSLFKLAAPWLQNLDPQRIAAVASVLSRLEILQREGVVLSMPEIRLE
ncbi:MAG TPA: signal peptide peptidase SppA [Candidatus Binatia bacterium]|jgi:protease-4|nr:signal peptide peptidase SppA [Candidatus Binatia bacterium]